MAIMVSLALQKAMVPLHGKNNTVYMNMFDNYEYSLFTYMIYIFFCPINTGPRHCTRSHCTRSYTALDRTALDRALFLIRFVELQCVVGTVSNAWLIHFSINYTLNLLP